MLIGQLIRKREVAGLTQTELAEKLGKYPSFVARLESGQRRVDVIAFLALAELLGFEPGKANREIGENSSPLDQRSCANNKAALRQLL